MDRLPLPDHFECLRHSLTASSTRADVMWSDPEEIETWAVSPRGAGWLFGSRVTTEFNHINGLELICRAHQLVQEGLKYMFPDKSLVTVRSSESQEGRSWLSTCLFRSPRDEGSHLRRLHPVIDLIVIDSLFAQVWSAPNYCYRCGNVASILCFDEKMVRKAISFCCARPQLLFPFWAGTLLAAVRKSSAQAHSV